MELTAQANIDELGIRNDSMVQHRNVTPNKL